MLTEKFIKEITDRIVDKFQLINFTPIRLFSLDLMLLVIPLKIAIWIY